MKVTIALLLVTLTTGEWPQRPRAYKEGYELGVIEGALAADKAEKEGIKLDFCPPKELDIDALTIMISNRAVLTSQDSSAAVEELRFLRETFPCK